MPTITEPEVFLLAKTEINTDPSLGIHAYLESLGVAQDDWDYDSSKSGSEIITEVSSRSCYMSYGTKLNANISQIREGNKPHLKNILGSGHGSVLEHASATFAFRKVSRVLTHEIVRHRAGCAVSQESLRYVRADNIGYSIPSAFKGNTKAELTFRSQFEDAEARYSSLLKLAAEQEGKDFSLEGFESLPMDIKKKYTSAIRRVIPMGMSTNIIWTANMRALRHVIETRTHISAEEEIRMVFQKVAIISREEWPNLFQDMVRNVRDEYVFDNRKV